MTTSNKLAMLLFVLPFAANSQNYQTVQSSATPFFIATQSDYFLANRIDQVDIIGTDSIFYPFQSIREDGQLNTNDPCKYYIGPSWMGDKIEIKANGDNVFYNHLDEQITIKTNAVLHDTFTVYTYPNGDWIKGVVNAISPVIVLGYPDSMKVIDLFSNVSLNLENPRFILSKDHGFIELFAPYSFPDPYVGPTAINGLTNYPEEHINNFSLVGEGANGFSKPTVGEINDFEIGDIHQFSYLEEVYSVSKTHEFTEREIFNKFIWGQDSIVYFLKQNGFKKTIDVASGTTEIEYLSGEMESWTIEHINQWQNAFLPEEFDGVNGWNSLFINDCGDVEEKVRIEAIEISGSSSCLHLTVGEFSETSAIKNVGNLSPTASNMGNSFQTTSSLVYYERPNGDFCGTQEVLSTTELEAVNMDVFPNPSNGLFQIESDENQLMSLYDLSGNLVYQQGIQKGINTIETDHPAGFYLLTLAGQEEIQSKKILIQE